MKPTIDEHAGAVAARPVVLVAGSPFRVADENAIRDLAFHIHEARGDVLGSAKLDWLEAELQVHSVRARHRPTPCH